VVHKTVAGAATVGRRRHGHRGATVCHGRGEAFLTSVST
jgi:hypothetical protein